MNIWRVGVSIIRQYSLQTMDAMHVATAQLYGLRDLAAVDDDYRRVPTITFWRIRD